MVSVVFPAAGAGRRMRADRNKVFLELAEKPILVHTLLKFSDCPSISELIVVVAAGEETYIEELLRGIHGLKPYRVATGGSERQYSIANGLELVDPAAEVILVHDAARPLVSPETIENVIKTARCTGAAIAAVPEKYTVKIVDENRIVKDTIPRETLWEVQTPQGFRRDILYRAYQKAKEDGFLGTDDASLVERMGVDVKVVESDYRNVKITTPEDLLLAEALLGDRTLSHAKGVAETALNFAAAKLKVKLHRT
ncbi:2-C-methyl-D-erythritol 4-phosphate cytidylyltransferase [Selenomonas sp. TAMA-11512]|uniref:2-C-methyl-D-erythritol 4-phosphate cytidylyltransferase n=1 Tax=Selenomonas sp. TAMA-11512 TaxID=3095337 RepID=UPI00308EC97A|nr:2-C-methyl-D-erythritol 4-phosphate cytidylyltransferase [Selenomonas sp. TAMA-11512]